MTPKKYPQNFHTQKNIYFSENPKKYRNSKFWTQKNEPSLRMYENIRVPPPPPPGTIPCFFLHYSNEYSQIKENMLLYHYSKLTNQ